MQKDLQDERAKSESLDQAKRQLKQNYDEDLASWQDLHRKLQDDLQTMHQSKRLRLPFDTWSSPSCNALNVAKCDPAIKQKQLELLERLRDIYDPLQQTGLPRGFEVLTKSLKNQFDGSMPVFDEDRAESSPSVKKFVVYFERVS